MRELGVLSLETPTVASLASERLSQVAAELATLAGQS